MLRLPDWVAAERLSTRSLLGLETYVLIGMAAVGKTTVGQRLAAELGVPFVDTDALLCEAEGCSVEDILRRKGPDGLCDLEAQVVLSLKAAPAMVATGGSVIYRPEAVRHLQRIGILLWLDAPTNEILARHRARDPRGLVWLPADLPTMEALIDYRATLYRDAADFRVNAPRH